MSQQNFAQAGPNWGLPFLLSVTLLVASIADGADQSKLEFHAFESTCINLGHYEKQTKRLTVHFLGARTNVFYRYSNVSPRQWAELIAQNNSGSVGAYFNETILANPKQHPFEEITVQNFRVRKKKSQ